MDPSFFKSNEVENYRYFSVSIDPIAFFSFNVSVDQFRIYGVVSDVYEEYSICQTRTGSPVLTGQCDPLFESAI